MVKVIEASHEKSERRKTYESLVKFIRKEAKQARPKLEVRITNSSSMEDSLLWVNMFATSDHKKQMALQINFFGNDTTGYQGISAIKLFKPQYFIFAYKLAEKYEKKLGKGEEVKIFK